MPVTATPETAEKVIIDGLIEVGAEPADVKPDATFTDLDVDSLDLVELAQIIEDEFGVEIVGDDVQNLKTVGDAINLVVAKTS